VEKRAYRLAVIATGNNDDALDIVQDAMLKLVQKYANRDEAEYGPLFHRILQTTIRDWYRRQKVRNQWRSFLKVTGMSQKSGDDNAESEHFFDPIENARQRRAHEPINQLASDNAMQALDTSLHGLPARQQQVFLLRVWEGLSVAETAQAMGCTQGSVKTHYFRAVHSLRKQLENYVET